MILILMITLLVILIIKKLMYKTSSMFIIWKRNRPYFSIGMAFSREEILFFKELINQINSEVITDIKINSAL